MLEIISGVWCDLNSTIVSDRFLLRVRQVLRVLHTLMSTFASKWAIKLLKVIYWLTKAMFINIHGTAQKVRDVVGRFMAGHFWNFATQVQWRTAVIENFSPVWLELIFFWRICQFSIAVSKYLLPSIFSDRFSQCGWTYFMIEESWNLWKVLFILCGKNVDFVSWDLNGQQNCLLLVFTWVSCLLCTGLSLDDRNKATGKW